MWLKGVLVKYEKYGTLSIYGYDIRPMIKTKYGVLNNCIIQA